MVELDVDAMKEVYQNDVAIKHLFVVRHGIYGSDERLSSDGKKQMETLGKNIKEILGGGSAYIVSSTAPRALDSSTVLSEQLGLNGFERLEYLWSGSDAPSGSYEYDVGVQARDKLVKIIEEREKKADGLILVAHLEIAEDLPSHFYNKRFNQKVNIGELSKGQAVHIDLEQRTYHILPRR